MDSIDKTLNTYGFVRFPAACKDKLALDHRIEPVGTTIVRMDAIVSIDPLAMNECGSGLVYIAGQGVAVQILACPPDEAHRILAMALSIQDEV